ncbi:hypothetical protein E2562_003426, partial [Oryza meyeriana var. granulata]
MASPVADAGLSLAAAARVCASPWSTSSGRPPCARVLATRTAPPRRPLLRSSARARVPSCVAGNEHSHSSVGVERLASWGMSDEEIAELRSSMPSWWLSIEEILEYDATDSSPAALRERFVRESKEAVAALKGAAAGVVRPLRELARDLRTLESVFHVEEFQIGMPFGAAMTCLGLWQLWTVAPAVCLDVALAYAFYKLSVMAADLRRQGFSADLIIRLKFVITIVMVAKDIDKKIIPLDYI